MEDVSEERFAYEKSSKGFSSAFLSKERERSKAAENGKADENI